MSLLEFAKMRLETMRKDERLPKELRKKLPETVDKPSQYGCGFYLPIGDKIVVSIFYPIYWSESFEQFEIAVGRYRDNGEISVVNMESYGWKNAAMRYNNEESKFIKDIILIYKNPPPDLVYETPEQPDYGQGAIKEFIEPRQIELLKQLIPILHSQLEKLCLDETHRLIEIDNQEKLKRKKQAGLQTTEENDNK